MPSTAEISDSQNFQAANILKNKLKIDYVTIKGSENAVQTLKMNMMNIIIEFANMKKPKFILKSLCLGFTFILFHSHQGFPSSELLNQLQNSMSATPEQAFCLLKILEYFASECEDDNVVIEESLRESLFDYIDKLSDPVFTLIYNQWAQKLTDD